MRLLVQLSVSEATVPRLHASATLEMGLEIRALLVLRIANAPLIVVTLAGRTV